MESPVVRERLGVELNNRTLYLRAPENRVAKALIYIVKHLPPVTQVHTKEQRAKFASELPSSVVVKPTLASGTGVALADAETKAPPRRSGKASSHLPRRPVKLIPNDCVLNITDARIRAIELELRRLKVEEFTNAVGTLLRVFLELSADAYIDRVPLPTTVDASLSTKLLDVAEHLVSLQKLTKQQANPVRRAAQKDSFLAPSVRQMHDYLHNRHAFPAPSDLWAHWNNLQPFVTAIWAP